MNDEIFSREPPHNFDAEEALLGCVMIDPAASFAEFSQIGLTHDAFFRPVHSLLYRVMQTMQPDQIDQITLAERCKQIKIGDFPDYKRHMDCAQSVFEYTGGHTLLNKVTSRIESTVNIQSWLSIVVDCYKKRRLLKSASETINKIFASSEQTDLISASLINDIASLSSQSRRSLQTSNEVVVGAMEEINEMSNPSDTESGIKTGLVDVDRLLPRGMRRGEMWIIAARPSMGKTTLAINILDRASVDLKIPALMISLEMINERIARNMILMRSRVNKSKIEDGIVSASEMDRVNQSAKDLANSKIYFEDNVKAIGGIVSICTSVAAKLQGEGTPLGLIVIDYAQLASSSISTSREQQIADISRNIKGLTKSLRVPIIALAQINRSIEKEARRPMLSDLRESGSLEQDADGVMFIYHNSDDGDVDVPLMTQRIFIAKNRDGQIGERKVIFNKPLYRFENHTEAY